MSCEYPFLYVYSVRKYFSILFKYLQAYLSWNSFENKKTYLHTWNFPTDIFVRQSETARPLLTSVEDLVDLHPLAFSGK